MPSEHPRLPAETWETLRTRGAAYCPALAFEVRELQRPRSGHGNPVLSALAVLAFVLTAIGWAVMLGGGQ